MSSDSENLDSPNPNRKRTNFHNSINSINSINPPNKKSTATAGEWPNLPATNNNQLIKHFESNGHKNKTNSNSNNSTKYTAEPSPAVAMETTEPKKPYVPPIVIRDKHAYSGVSKTIKDKKLNINKAQTVSEGVKIFPDTPLDYNQIIKILGSKKIPFHSFRFPEEKELHVVLRGVVET